MTTMIIPICGLLVCVAGLAVCAFMAGYCQGRIDEITNQPLPKWVRR